MIYSTVQVSYSAVCRLWTAKSQYDGLISVYQSAGAPEFEKQLGEVQTMVIFFFLGGGAWSMLKFYWIWLRFRIGSSNFKLPPCHWHSRVKRSKITEKNRVTIIEKTQCRKFRETVWPILVRIMNKTGVKTSWHSPFKKILNHISSCKLFESSCIIL